VVVVLACVAVDKQVRVCLLGAFNADRIQVGQIHLIVVLERFILVAFVRLRGSGAIEDAC